MNMRDPIFFNFFLLSLKFIKFQYDIEMVSKASF
jgi:hypothetical protein